MMFAPTLQHAKGQSMNRKIDRASIASCSVPIDIPETGRKTIFSSIMSALHHSRSLQARRILRQYTHLNAEDPPHQTIREEKMSIEKKIRGNRPVPLSVSRDVAWVAIAAVLLLFHVIGGTVLQAHSASGPTQQEEASHSSYD
jgi:hypothetical protein